MGEDEDEDAGVKESTRSKPADLKRAEAALDKLKDRLKNYEGQLAVKDQTKKQHGATASNPSASISHTQDGAILRAAIIAL